MNVKKIKFLLKNSLSVFLGVLIVVGVVMGISYSNIVDQSKATIDYVYAVDTGTPPEFADWQLAKDYCQNEVALNVSYPEFKDKCAEIIAKHPDENKANDGV